MGVRPNPFMLARVHDKNYENKLTNWYLVNFTKYLVNVLKFPKYLVNVHKIS